MGNPEFSSQPLENCGRLLLYTKTVFPESFSYVGHVVPPWWWTNFSKKKFQIFFVNFLNKKVHLVGNPQFSSQPPGNCERILFYTKTVFPESFSYLGHVMSPQWQTQFSEKKFQIFFVNFRNKKVHLVGNPQFLSQPHKNCETVLLFTNVVLLGSFSYLGHVVPTWWQTLCSKKKLCDIYFFRNKKFILWEIHSFQTSLLKIQTFRNHIFCIEESSLAIFRGLA